MNWETFFNLMATVLAAWWSGEAHTQGKRGWAIFWFLMAMIGVGAALIEIGG